jgi:hypothetical protein
MTDASRLLRPAAWVALFLAGSAVFSAAYCQAPLYYSNQNQYFLHGLARAGYGLLDEDWLANTADPTPAFSTLVALTARHLHPWAFHVYHALLLGAYAAAMLGLFAWLAGPETAARRWPAFLLVFVAVHSALARWLSYRLAHDDYPWFLQAGVAGQYVLGAMLQPSVFGVLLVLAVCLFARGRPFLAAVFTGLAGDLHATYLLPGAMLTLGFMTALLAERRLRAALGVGALALVLVLPAVAYVLLRFGPTSPEAYALAQDVLVNLRIPHHARVDLWLDPVAGLQIVWVVLALALTWRTRLFPVLAVPFALAALLTGAQVATGSRALALLFPWRVSAVLVPIATTVVLSRLVALPALPLGGKAVGLASAFGVAALAGAGVWIMANRMGFRLGDDELPMMDFVRGSRSPGDVYLVPVRVPDLTKQPRGSLSSDFKPLAEKKVSTRVIPVDLQRFRLYTGAPIYVDFKSIPYKDTDVLEWRDRLFQARSLQEEVAAGRLDSALAELRRLGVTHLVTPAGQRLSAPGLEWTYEDSAYQVYRLTAPE